MGEIIKVDLEYCNAKVLWRKPCSFNLAMLSNVSFFYSFFFLILFFFVQQACAFDHEIFMWDYVLIVKLILHAVLLWPFCKTIWMEFELELFEV